LTATPIENRLSDLYSVMSWVDPHPFGKKAWFEGRFCKILQLRVKKRRKNGSVYNVLVPKIIGHKNLKEAESRICERYIRRTAMEVKEEMPKVSSITYFIDLTKEARSLYDTIANNIKGETSLFNKIIPLRRCCAAPCLVGGTGDDSGKIEELIRLLETELDGESVVISTAWKTDWIGILRNKLKRWKPLVITGDTDNIAREAIRKRFMDGESNILLMTSVGTYGLNLQKASAVIILDLDWNPAKLLQRVGRIVRMGSPHDKVRIISILAKDTIEERMVDILSAKQNLFEAIFTEEGLMEATNMMSSLSDSKIRKLI